MLPEHIRSLKSAASIAIAKHAYMNELLQKHLVADPVDVESFDLNPHLNVMRIAVSVAGEVVAGGFECDAQDVLLYWLTTTLHTFKHNA